MNNAIFEDLLGVTLTKISGEVGDESITFFTDDGSVFELSHDQECCESVKVEDIAGDFADIIGSEILLAEEVSSQENPDDVNADDLDQLYFTWTFYKLATKNGHVTVRWYSSSNGYYSEKVDFYRL